tara:strand:- start:713 stop:844 length:132 start_codon:yes stop_codon:yes gene_type:complete
VAEDTGIGSEYRLSYTKMDASGKVVGDFQEGPPGRVLKNERNK